MTDPDNLPPPDLLDETGRLRRLAIALVVAGVCGAIAYMITNGLAKPDDMPGGFDGGSQRRAFGFVFYTTALVFVATFALTLAIQNHLEKRKWRHQQIPKAKIHN